MKMENVPFPSDFVPSLDLC